MNLFHALQREARSARLVSLLAVLLLDGEKQEYTDLGPESVSDRDQDVLVAPCPGVDEECRGGMV